MSTRLFINVIRFYYTSLVLPSVTEVTNFFK